MNDRVGIYILLAVFVALAAFPIWYTLGASGETGRPELAPARAGTQCVEDLAYMTPNHMNLLNDWRDAVVRDGGRDYVSTTGVTFRMSLTDTCLDCHGDAEAFCTTCHDYVNVHPTCWDCHVEQGGR